MRPSDLLGSPSDLIVFRFTDTLQFVFKKVFFLFCNEILHTISCSFINLFIYMKPSFFVFQP